MIIDPKGYLNNPTPMKPSTVVESMKYAGLFTSHYSVRDVLNTKILRRGMLLAAVRWCENNPSKVIELRVHGPGTGVLWYANRRDSSR